MNNAKDPSKFKTPAVGNIQAEPVIPFAALTTNDLLNYAPGPSSTITKKNPEQPVRSIAYAKGDAK